jgi:hypothetical protein
MSYLMTEALRTSFELVLKQHAVLLQAICADPALGVVIFQASDAPHASIYLRAHMYCALAFHSDIHKRLPVL